MKLLRGNVLAWEALLLFSIDLLCTLTTASYVSKTFIDSTNNGNFNHFVVDKNTGKVYIGAVNRIYQLTEDLISEKSVTTGPANDNPNCPPTGECSCLSEDDCTRFIRKPVDSINKALVIDYRYSRLITCSNLFQGHCERRLLDDVTQKDPPVFVPIVPNDKASPAVLFLAPGPPALDNVMYVGATRSVAGLAIYRDEVHSVSSRNINTFELAQESFEGSTKKVIESQHRETFRINYVAGFSSDGFSYFVTVQRESVTSQKYVSRLVRVCQNDPKYFSYSEVPLECNHSGTSYNLVQAVSVRSPGAELARSLNIPTTEDVFFAAFSVSHVNSNRPTSNSALCVYSMREIRSKFTLNIHECFQGVGNTGPAHIVQPLTCMRSTLPVTDSYCGEYNINTPIAGTNAVSATAVLKFPKIELTSIGVSVTYDYTVAFVGTKDGHVKKVVVESGTIGTEYEDITLRTSSEESYVSQNILFDRSGTHLYAMTTKKVFKVKVQECGKYTNCRDCLGVKDPYCGWCSLENKCSLRRDCMNADDPMRWLPYSGFQCTTISSVSPSQVQIGRSKTTTLVMSIQNLPALTGGNYQCAQNGHGVTLTTTAIRTPSGVQCETPFPNLLPPIPTGKDHIRMVLSIRMNNKDFVSTNFTFFDCGVHSSCTTCTQSDFPCTWCVQNHKCTRTQEACLGDTLVTGQNFPGTSDRPGPMFCPRIEASFTEILVPSGTEKVVSVKAVNLQPFQSNFQCWFNLKGGKFVPATKTGSDLIECSTQRFEYYDDTPYHNVPFKIIWGNNKALDNPTTIQVKVYKCSAMADICGSCLTMDAKFNCGWCENKCSIQKQCLAKWLGSSSICPNPVLTRFYPSTGPIDGGTNVTIEGQNLGKIFNDIQSGVSVADIPCVASSALYKPAQRIVCTTGDSNGIAKSGVVKVLVNNRFLGESAEHFRYVQPKIERLHPTKGPRSGGTNLTILGQYMNAGSSLRIKVGGLECAVISKSPTATVCQTSQQQNFNVENTVGVTMWFDKAKVRFRQSFTYTEDPTINGIERENAILSGGLWIQVSGTNLDTILKPKMYVRIKNQDYVSRCYVKTASKMNCSSPNIAPSGVSVNITNLVDAPYGFILDNVTALRNLSSRANFANFIFYPNPTFEQFPAGVKTLRAKSNEYLTINGENLNPPLRAKDIVVRVGHKYCNITSVATNQLTCRPPDMSGTGSRKASVVVAVGKNLLFDIGALQLEEQAMLLPLPAIIGITAGGGVLLLGIIVIFIAYRRKSQESDRVMKRMQTQMDVLEARVAKECKEAFAELQTDMTELTSDVQGMMGFPFRDYRSFCMQVLFPNVDEYDHPVTRELEVDPSRREEVERGLRIFGQLMGNKTFILLFIRTLEANKYFTMRDRVNVASLISVALQNRMEYHTDILKTLLSELIERSVEGNNHPKLLLRRTESVAEKMLTNWFTFLLYKFLRECAGEPLFMLFRAIKQQVDKGPVDAMTSEAKYSLSEDKLIRQSIDFKTLIVRMVDDQYNQEHPVKVLDCDTISQVKEKALDHIYKNAPYSTRPPKDDLDLEWRTGVKGKLILVDEDLSSESDGGHKKINTLKHYKVPDGAVMSLVQKQSSTYNLSIGSNNSHGSHRYARLYGKEQEANHKQQQQQHNEKKQQINNSSSFYGSGSPALSRSVTQNQVDAENGVQSFHLVKTQESDVQKEGDRGSKMVSEIYLTRLLATKGTLQQFVDDLFETIFSTAHRGSALPMAIKYMFDFLDDQAMHHGIADTEVVHTWKSNSLPLRFWVNIVKNPNFVFDMHKSNIVDSCLTVVAQTFMDSCSMIEHRLGKDSPSSKLLYAKDIPKYKKWVERYYLDIKMMPPFSDQDMNAMLAEESRMHSMEFNTIAALKELYMYAVQYSDDLNAMLEEDEFARKNRLLMRLEQVHEILTPQLSSSC